VGIDFLARESHFADHLIPTWQALPKRLRGTFYAHPQMLERLSAAGVDVVSVEEAPESGPLTLVASYRDMKAARDLRRLVVYSEHGAGQAYRGVNSGSYIGAIDRAGVVGVLVPGPASAGLHSAVHPTIPAYPIGCPKLDGHHLAPRRRHKRPVVAISFHWECRLCRETRGAHKHYLPALPKLAERFDLIGHGHPRILRILRRPYEDAGIEIVEDFEEVIERADVYCIDNSSTMYEWASLDRPVVVLNAPWYRRRVEHGLRFWSHADVGPQVWQPAALPGAVDQALAEDPTMVERRREIVSDVYVACDGKATKRAVAALQELAKEWL
jgi:CDP-Glycerol:Poly(glycerophosphate) glycerophosphotransferase